jgi:hypothetical protein
MKLSSWAVVLFLGSVAAAGVSCAKAAGQADSGEGGDASTSDTSSSATSSSTTGAGGASSTSGTGAGGDGPCIYAEDCAAFADDCNDGACVNGECVKLPANDGLGCDDGKTCTIQDSCQAGVCTGPLNPCTSDDPCHVAVCDVATDQCVDAPGNDGATCVDDDPCTVTSFCSGGECAPGQATDCSFLNSVCGTGTCDPQIGCVATPLNDGSACDDGLYCTINDACKNGVCSGEPNTCAAPGDICLIGACDENNDTCAAVPGNEGVACDDLSSCTMGEKCAAGVCGGGASVNQGVACDDGDACTTNEKCQAGLCIGSAIVACIDGDGCCAPGCDNVTDDDCTCLGWMYNGGCWYTASAVGMTCAQVCAPHGGLDLVHTQHTGNDIGQHFWPNKADGSDWVSIECSSTDNNTNWGANGTAPDVNFSHPACYVNCACLF